MKKTVAFPELIAKQSKTRITKLLQACRKLKKSYERKTGLEDCPLCGVCDSAASNFHTRCGRCPWHTIKGVDLDGLWPCVKSDFASGTIGSLRGSPHIYPDAANARAKELTWWIEVYEAELERRQK